MSTQSRTGSCEEARAPDLDLNSSSEEETGFDCLQDNSDIEEETQLLQGVMKVLTQLTMNHCCLQIYAGDLETD